MGKNWIFIILLSMAALSLAGTAAYFSVFGLTKLFYAAGLGITILAASLEFAKLVTVSYVYRYWNSIKKGLRGFYIFAVVFIMLLTSIGIYGFLTSAYQKSANKVEMRDSQIKIAENKKNVFVAQSDRINKSIESSSDRINTLSGLRKNQESRLDTLYNRNFISVAKRAETQISSSDDQIKNLNLEVTSMLKQINVINDSVSFYDQKINELKNSDISNEIGPYKFVADLTGISIGRIVNIVAILIVLVFDPLAIALLIGVNQLTMLENPIYGKKEDEEPKKKDEEIKEEIDEPIVDNFEYNNDIINDVFNDENNDESENTPIIFSDEEHDGKFYNLSDIEIETLVEPLEIETLVEPIDNNVNSFLDVFENENIENENDIIQITSSTRRVKSPNFDLRGHIGNTE